MTTAVTAVRFPTSRACHDCAAEVPTDARFCPQCGSRLSFEAPSAFPPLEKRQATVLLCDIVDSSHLSKVLDPEDYHLLVRRMLDEIRDAVYRYRPRGHRRYDRTIGDSLLFCFGLPVAGERDARDAVVAALAAVAAVRGVPAPNGVDPRIRVGIATGDVVSEVDRTAADGPPIEVTGVAPNLAARLQAVANPGGIVICRATHALVGHEFLCESAAELDLKGLGVHQGWHIRERRTVPDRQPHQRHVTAVPFVGREPELRIMLDRWEAACQGVAGTLLVQGEPGVGKSRLLHEFQMRVQQEGILVMDVRCSRAHRNTPFYAIAEHLERTFRLPPAAADGARETRLRDVFVGRFGLPSGDLPQVAGFLTPAGFEIGTSSPAEAKARRDEAVRSMIALLYSRVRAHRAAVAFIEDVQWADASSLEFLSRIIGQATDLKLLFVFSARPEFDTAELETTAVEVIPLRPLTEAQSAILISQMDAGNLIPPSVTERVIAKCDGVPLFLAELTRSLFDSMHRELPPPERESTLMDALSQVPLNLRGLLTARLDRTPYTRAVAQLGAVVGREFSRSLIESLSSLPVHEIDQGLRDLVDADLIREIPAAHGTQYAFKHALIQEVAYDSLLGGPRRQLHARVAEALSDGRSGIANPNPEVIATHYAEAGMAKEAIHHWGRASDHATERFANIEAASHLKRAIAMVSALDDAELAAETELALRARIVPPLLAAYGYASDDIATNTARATELFPRTRAAAHKIVILRAECQWAIVRARYGRAMEISEAMTRLAAETGDSGVMLDALLLQGLVELYAGKLTQSRATLERCIGLYEPHEHAAHALRQGVDIRSAAPAYLSRTLWLLGDTGAARDAVDRAVTLATTSPIPLAETQASCMKMLFHLISGDVDEARIWCARTCAVAQRKGQVFWIRLVNIVEAWLDTLDDTTPAAAREIDRCIAEYRATGSGLGLSWLLLLRKDAEERAGLGHQALATIQEALEFVRDSDERYYLPEIHRQRGVLLWKTLGAPELARAALDEALKTAAEIGARAWEVRAAHSCAELLIALGAPAAARSLLERILSATSGLDIIDAGRARTLLNQLS